MRHFLTALLAGGSLLIGESSDARKDTQLRAMLDELARARTLHLNDLDKPYFIEFDCGDTEESLISASLGGLIISNRTHFRIPRMEVRVGDYSFDNTNAVFSGFPRFGTLPVDDNYDVFRTSFWLAADSMYKAAAEQMTRKRNALREVADPDKTPDFLHAQPVQVIDDVPKLDLDQHAWEDVLRRTSGRFAAYDGLRSSSVVLQVISSTYRLVNSEGTIVRTPQGLNSITIRSDAQSADGNTVWNHAAFTVASPSQFPDESALTKAVESIAAETQALAKAPVADDFSGPVLVEQEAAAQMMASVLSDAIRLKRKPLTPPGAEAPEILESVWATKLGARVAPDWMTLVDDPSVTEFNGVGLAGAYDVDDEGVRAQKVTLVENGALKGFLSSREPVRNITASNGHGRLPGGYGSQEGVIGNLFVKIQNPTPESQMKAKLIEKIKASGAKYGLIIRRLDFPFFANFDELQSMARQLQKSGYARTLNSPILAYRVYPDGREELVRGLRFKDFSAKDLRDLDAASDRPYVFNYMNNGSELNFAEAASDETTSTVICPSLLFDSLDLARAENDPGRQPIVPAPPLVAQR